MKKKNFQKGLTVGVGIILFGGLITSWNGYQFFATELSTVKQNWAALEAKLGKKNNDLERLKYFAENIETVKVELRELNLQLETAIEHMPRTFDLSGLLRKLTLLAQNSGLEISKFNPSGEVPNEEKTFYRSITVDFVVDGTFTQTLTFLDQLSRLKRIVKIEKLQLRRRGESQRVGSYLARTEATLRAYRFND